MKQLSHDLIHNSRHNLTIVLICERLQSPANLGSICRISESFGVSKFYVHQNNIHFLKSNRYKKTARHSNQYINIERYNDCIELILSLKQQQFECVALEYTINSNVLSQTNFNSKTALIVGNEISGVSDEVLKNVDKITHIDMYGCNTSMNVTQASAIALYECVNQQL